MPHPIGILGVVQTPFTEQNEIDIASHERLVQSALEAGVDGFLVPAVASENALLSFEEKILLAKHVQAISAGHVPVIWGAGSFDPTVCALVAETARKAGAAACLVAISPELYRNPSGIVPFFERLAGETSLPLMIQDYDPAGPGMAIETTLTLSEKVKTFRYLKVESLPAGPKYSAVLDAAGDNLHVSGGWAVQQMIEALDRGVHAMIPECSMIRIYKHIDTLHRAGQRDAARAFFNRLLPVLSFTNQQLDVSIRFFKRLLVRKGIFKTAKVRLQSADFDVYSERISDELTDHVLSLESEISHDLV